MPTQTDVQQMIQGLTPGATNNGNPNTAWNVAPPTQNGEGNWFSSNLPNAASIEELVRGSRGLDPSVGGWVPPQATQPVGGGTGGPLANLPPLGTNPGWQAPQPGTGGGTGGGTTNPGATPVTGGGTGPQGQGGNMGPATGGKTNTGGGGGSAGAGWGTNQQGGRTLHGVDVSTWANSFRNQGLPVTSTGQINTAKMTNNDWNKFFDSDAMKTALNIGGNLADLFVPGNAYLQNSGKIDVSNIVTGLLENAIPFFNVLPGNQVDWMVDKLADYLNTNEDGWLSKLIPDVIEDALKDHAKDNKDEKAAKNAKRSGGGGGSPNPFGYNAGKTTDGLSLGSNFGNSWSGTITVGDTPFQVGGSSGGGGGGGGGGGWGGGGGGGGFGSTGGGSGGHKGAKQAFLDMSQA